jgi:hypothetical protein
MQSDEGSRFKEMSDLVVCHTDGQQLTACDNAELLL